MKVIMFHLVMVFAYAGCAGNSPEVTFTYFNLSTNEIWVTDITGLPPDATPGRLMPSREETLLQAKSSVFSETVRIEDRITVLWKDNGTQGWPGGLKTPGAIPSGTTHQIELKRDDLGIPAKLTSGKIWFTYLGNEKWHVRMIN